MEVICDQCGGVVSRYYNTSKDVSTLKKMVKNWAYDEKYGNLCPEGLKKLRKHSKMEKLKLYTVTKPSSDGTFVTGDIIWLSANGDLNSCKGKGWLSKAEWDASGTNDFEVEPCKTHYLDVSRWSETVREVENISK